jgi:hypothetical protein
VSRSRRTLVAVGLVALGLSLGAAAAGLQDAIGSETPPPRVARPPAPPPPPAYPAPPASEPLEVVARFTTAFTPGEPRVVNIERAVALLDGLVVAPGGTFSLNDALGERTPERGFVPAPTIVGGRLVDSVGGGISQVATMLYNGAFFAGLELVEHQPHTIFIDRYPPGREATISWGGPELVFRNDWPAPLVIELDTTARSITVRFVTERLGRRVETTTGEPYAHRPDGGFTIEYTRRVYRGDVLRRDERFRWTYDSGPPVPATGR